MRLFRPGLRGCMRAFLPPGGGARGGATQLSPEYPRTARRDARRRLCLSRKPEAATSAHPQLRHPRHGGLCRQRAAAVLPRPARRREQHERHTDSRAQSLGVRPRATRERKQRRPQPQRARALPRSAQPGLSGARRAACPAFAPECPCTALARLVAPRPAPGTPRYGAGDHLRPVRVPARAVLRGCGARAFAPDL